MDSIVRMSSQLLCVYLSVYGVKPLIIYITCQLLLVTIHCIAAAGFLVYLIATYA